MDDASFFFAARLHLLREASRGLFRARVRSKKRGFFRRGRSCAASFKKFSASRAEQAKFLAEEPLSLPLARRSGGILRRNVARKAT